MKSFHSRAEILLFVAVSSFGAMVPGEFLLRDTAKSQNSSEG
jgi:hypothetical protein